jgi:hypothetical protein
MGKHHNNNSTNVNHNNKSNHKTDSKHHHYPPLTRKRSLFTSVLLQRNDVAQITVDTTNLLVAEQATALCTRIIGVRETTKSL